MFAWDKALNLPFQRSQVHPQQPFEGLDPTLDATTALRFFRWWVHRDRSPSQLGHDGLSEGLQGRLIVCFHQGVPLMAECTNGTNRRLSRLFFAGTLEPHDLSSQRP